MRPRTAPSFALASAVRGPRPGSMRTGRRRCPRPYTCAVIPLLPGFRLDGTPDAAVAERAARTWLAGGLVGLPTETVYGLAADAQDPAAVARIYRVKGRPPGHPLIVHVPGSEAIAGWAAGDVPVARALAARFWPGPLTVIVPRSGRAGDVITGGQDTVALRCPAHPVAHACLAALAARSGDPARGVAAPSANRYGRVSPTRAGDVLAELGERLDPQRDVVIDGGPARVGLESTIVDCTAPRPVVLRPGAISQEQVDDALSPGAPAPGTPAGEPEMGSSPSGVRTSGTLPSHYAPAARVTVAGPRELQRIAGTLPAGRRVGLIAEAGVATPDGWVRLAAPRASDEYAHQLYGALRRADLDGLTDVVAVPPDGSDALGRAVWDRLRRAAHERPSAGSG